MKNKIEKIKDKIFFWVLIGIVGVLAYHFIYLNFFRYRVQYALGKATIEEALDAYRNPLDEQLDASLLWDKVQNDVCVLETNLDCEGNGDLAELLSDDALLAQWELQEEWEAALEDLKEEISCKKCQSPQKYALDSKRVVEITIPQDAANYFIDRIRPLADSIYHPQEAIMDNLEQAGIDNEELEKVLTDLLNSRCSRPVSIVLVFNEDNQVRYFDANIYLEADDSSGTDEYRINLYGPCAGDERTLDKIRSTFYISREGLRLKGHIILVEEIVNYKQYRMQSEDMYLTLQLEDEMLQLNYESNWDGNEQEYDVMMSLGTQGASTGWSAKGTWSDVVEGCNVTLNILEGSVWTCKGEQADFAGSINIVAGK